MRLRTKIGAPLALALLLAATATPAFAQQFGGAIALGGDEIFVSETRNQVFPGLVYVFHKADGGTWQEAATLAASDATGTADRFGRALAAEGETLLVGASARNSSTGAVYVFQKNGATWTEMGHLTASDGAEGDAFGNTIALQDGVALIAAPSQNEQTGAVYVFRRGADGMWSEHARLAGSDLEGGDLFGAAMAFDGHMALIGAPSKNEGQGAVYAFRHDAASDTWTEMGKLEPNRLERGNRFGSAIGLRDGVAFIGAPRFMQREGTVFVFAHNEEDGSWNPQGRLAAFDAQRNKQFGASIAFDGDDVWVGTPGDARGTGALYLFRGSATSGSWMGVSKLTGRDLEGRAAFGNTAMVQGNLAVVGATGVDFGEGAALIFERDAGSGMWHEKSTVVNAIKGYDSITGGTVQCDGGEAATWQCDQVDLVSFLAIKDIGGKRGTRANDIWGWTDPQTDREYALVGRSDGTSFVDVTNASNPVYLGDLPKTEGSRSNVWRDIKVYKDHAFIVADGAGDHGMQVFDLTQLRNVPNPPATFEATAHYTKIASAHNIVINEDTGFAFSVGSSSGGETCGGGLHMIDIREPSEPTFAGCFADPTTGRRKTGYSHDAQCVIYHGPDTEHQGKEICLGSNETAISISDVTDKDNPVAISMATYPKVAYTHQGWLTEDHRYFYMNDEGDEPQGLVEGTRTLIWDLADLDDPVLVKEFIAETTTTDHNLYIKGNLMYQSNYGSGLRILDITNPENPVEVGYFDTTPHDGGGGSWSNYPYFKSGVIIVTGIGEGLFVLKKKNVDI